jgi:hypothetical protein
MRTHTIVARLALVTIATLACARSATAQTDSEVVIAGAGAGAESHPANHRAHMHMSPMRPPQPGDSARAAALLVAARAAMAPYADYHAAIADGYKIFAPKVPQRIYHFSRWQNTIRARWRFDPAKPSSLLYEKTGDSTFRLVGVMYTAPQHATDAELDARVPLSVGRWHLHTNICVPPRIRGWSQHDAAGQPLFGPGGSIATAEACQAAGGRFLPVALGWMVHVYPTAPDPHAVWGSM